MDFFSNGKKNICMRECEEIVLNTVDLQKLHIDLNKKKYSYLALIQVG
jgi:hypothetical protein